MENQRNVRVNSQTAVAWFSPHARDMLFDPDRPTVSPDELLKELGGMTDPRLVNHNCPVCHKTMRWELFVAHAEGCMRQWFHTMDVIHHKFPGAAPEEPKPEVKNVSIGAPPAGAGTS